MRAERVISWRDVLFKENGLLARGSSCLERGGSGGDVSVSWDGQEAGC